MALPSQMDRSTSGSRVSARSSGARGKPLMVVLGLLVAAGAIYGVYRLLPEGATKPADAGAGTIEPSPNNVAQKPTQTPGVGSLAGKSPERTPTPTPSNSPGTVQAGAGKPAPVDVTQPDLRPLPPSVPNPAPAANTPGPIAEPLAPAISTTQVRRWMEAGDLAASSGKVVEARAAYSKALLSPDAGPTDLGVLREKLTAINNDLLFSPKVTPNDPLVESYVVASGDSLERIVRRRELAVDWRFVQRVNAISNPNALRVGQKLKLPRGPFHAVVHKQDFRLDLFAGSPDEPDSWLYIRSFNVGLGSENGTPAGLFKIKRHSKLINPHWANPRTGERFAADDPKNPIGEHWLGWEGLGDARVYVGFGLHGTIEPDSIGKQKSMGCVRMLPDDIALVYEMLVEEVSTVRVTQ